MLVTDLNCTPPAEDEIDDDDAGVQMDEDAGVQHAGTTTVAFQKFSVNDGRKKSVKLQNTV